MNEIIFIGLGVIALLVIKGLQLFSKQLDKIHKDIRRTIELGFYSQKRERKMLKK